MDYIPGKEAEIQALLSAWPFDYVIGSVHWLDGWGFDFVGDEECLAEWERRDKLALYAAYFNTLVKAAQSGLFSTLGHPDIIRIMGIYPSGEWFDLAERAIRAVADTGVCLECSTAGLRKPVGEIYPSEQFLRTCQAHGVLVTLASDAHEPEDTGRDFERSVELLKACGYQEFQVFTARNRAAVVLP
jgi:histidinol-phosphatase (PHP family)